VPHDNFFDKVIKPFASYNGFINDYTNIFTTPYFVPAVGSLSQATQLVYGSGQERIYLYFDLKYGHRRIFKPNVMANLANLI
jgi:hypothetical protein